VGSIPSSGISLGDWVIAVIERLHLVIAVIERLHLVIAVIG
jgi:hypothetical protein